ncbi:MAG: hypothetical protein WAP03_06570 [Methylorubrum rhodinum]|uniref:hypothetical protein n=1 Tax=Methylorubrum rhodinum TaxID=29428 RepID=UPI003BB19149
MPARRLPTVASGLLALLFAGSAHAEPARKVLALAHDRPDPKVVADRLADVAQRCWLPRAPGFEGLKFDCIEPGLDPNSYRVIFAEKKKTKTPRYLRVLVGDVQQRATIVLVEQEGIDASETVGDDARAIVKGRATSC